MVNSETFKENHYRVSDLVKMWKVSASTVVRLVKDDPGVAKLRIGPKKVKTTYSIPESVVRRLHNRMLDGAA